MVEEVIDLQLLIKGRILGNKTQEKLEKLEKSMMKMIKDLTEIIVEVDHKLHMKEEAEVEIPLEQLCMVNIEVE